MNIKNYFVKRTICLEMYDSVQSCQQKAPVQPFSGQGLSVMHSGELSFMTQMSCIELPCCQGKEKPPVSQGLHNSNRKVGAKGLTPRFEFENNESNSLESSMESGKSKKT